MTAERFRLFGRRDAIAQSAFVPALRAVAGLQTHGEAIAEARKASRETLVALVDADPARDTLARAVAFAVEEHDQRLRAAAEAEQLYLERKARDAIRHEAAVRREQLP